MKNRNSLELERETTIEEWKILSNKLLEYEKQIDTIKNWCIITIIALVGFLIKFSHEIISVYPIVSLLPLFVIFFFAFNEFFKRTWKWEIFERLYVMEELIRKKFEYYPSFLSYGVRKKLKKQKGTKNYKIEDISAINFFKNTLLVRSFAFFYGLLLFSCSIFFPWLSSDFDIPIIINFIFLSIGILSISWIFLSARDFLEYMSRIEKYKRLIMVTAIVSCALLFVILVVSYKGLFSPVFKMNAEISSVVVNVFITAVNVGILYYISRQVKIANHQAKTAQKTNQQAVMPILGITTLGQDRKDPGFHFLVVYVRYGIAREIECKIFKNEEETPFFEENSRTTAVPPLKGDILMWIWEPISIKEDVSNLNEGKRLEFKAKFTHKSIFGDEYKSEYFLTIWNESGEFKKRENIWFKILPWDE